MSYEPVIDDRTSKYLTELRNDIGWLGGNCGWDDIEALLKKHGLFNTANLQFPSPQGRGLLLRAY